jgi:hypothetical protein
MLWKVGIALGAGRQMTNGVARFGQLGEDAQFWPVLLAIVAAPGTAPWGVGITG